MPYDMAELRFNSRFTERKPDFDRNGKQINGVRHWVTLVLGLGSKSSKAATLRWVMVLFLCYMAVARKDAWKLGWLRAS